MRRRRDRLTPAAVRAAKPGTLLPDGGGLYLQTSESGAQSWLFRFGLRGRERWMGLGAVADVGLRDARDVAHAARMQLRERIDPIEARRAKRAENELLKHKGTTFRECAEALIASHEGTWRSEEHRRQWRSSMLLDVYPTIGNVPVQAIDTPMVLKVLEPKWKKKPETMSRIRGRIESVLDWAKARGIRNGSENPARWSGHLDHLLPAVGKVKPVRHHAALPYDEVGWFMAQLRAQDGIRQRALEFIVLTAARAGEALNATWGEVDLTTMIWTIPAKRMKGGREHRVPLSPRASEILKTMRPGKPGHLIFPARADRPLLTPEIDRIRNAIKPGITTHGFRSAFKDWCSEQTSFPNEVSEAALAHGVGDRVEAAYRRGDLFKKRRRLMDAWAEFCGRVGEAGKVVPIGAAKHG